MKPENGSGMIGGVSFETSGDIVTKSAFASLIGVSAGRVSQFLSEKKIFGDALVGEGRCARIRVSVACQQLKRNLDISQRFGNGITIRLDQPLPVSEVGPPADPIEERPGLLRRQSGDQRSANYRGKTAWRDFAPWRSTSPGTCPERVAG